jgi:methionyl-tRNA synthetase
LKAIGFGSDGSFSWEDLNARYHSELANGFGNLASRTIAMVNRYFDGVLPAAGTLEPADEAVVATAKSAVSGAEAAIDKVLIHEAIAKSWTLVDELNSYITSQEPWVLAKEEANRERLATVLNTASEGLRVLSVLLAPVMPKATHKLFAAIAPGVDLASQSISSAATWGQLKVGTKFADLEPLFPRVEDQ